MAEVLENYSILDSIPDPIDYKSFTDRYFTRRYIRDFNGIERNDIMILFHSNRIALLTLAPSHPFFEMTANYKINFCVGKVNRLSNCVSGKGKRGGQNLTLKSVVCTIEFDDGMCFDIPSGIKGTLVEVNENLIDNPQLLKDFPESNGYIAIILSTISASEEFKKDLMTHEDYLKSRAEECSSN